MTGLDRQLANLSGVSRPKPTGEQWPTHKARARRRRRATPRRLTPPPSS